MIQSTYLLKVRNSMHAARKRKQSTFLVPYRNSTHQDFVNQTLAPTLQSCSQYNLNFLRGNRKSCEVVWTNSLCRLFIGRGNPVNITCKPTGTPDEDVRWIHKGQVKSSGSKTAYLTFNTISKTKAEIYTSRAKNSTGRTEKELNIVVNCECSKHLLFVTLCKGWNFSPTHVRHFAKQRRS